MLYKKIGSLVIAIAAVLIVWFCLKKQPDPQKDIDVVGNKHFIEEVLYTGLTGFGPLEEQERKLIEKDYTKKTSTYGEIPYVSAQQLLECEVIGFCKQDVFYDLGAGVGKLVVQVYLNTPVTKAVGVELSPTRHQKSQIMCERLQKSEKIEKKRTIELRHGDILDTPLDDATVVFMCSTCYAPPLMEQLVHKLSRLKKGLRVISLKELPESQQHGFQKLKTYRLPMTWSKEKGSDVHLYRLEEPRA